MTTKLTVLRPKDRVQLDNNAIATIYRALGAPAAEGVVTRALTELAVTMACLADQIRDRELEDIQRLIRRLTRMADHLGMVSLGRVAQDVGHCLETGDATAFAAVWARLLRIAESSLATEYESCDGAV